MVRCVFIDYRRLNSVSKRDSYNLPRMDHGIDSFGRSKIFTTLDANWGGWQRTVKEINQAKIAFFSHESPSEFKRIPFGLINAPTSFQIALDVIISTLKCETCLVCLEDVIFLSPNVEEHIEQLLVVLQALKKAGISLKIDNFDVFT